MANMIRYLGMSENLRSSKMANWPIPKLLISMALPAIFSMWIAAMYNIVDSIYISRYSDDALFAMGLVFPLQMAAFAIALGSSVGTGTLVARRLGERKNQQAQSVASTGFILTSIHMLVVMILGSLLAATYISLFTKREEIILMGASYLHITMFFSFGSYYTNFFEKLFQSQGNMIVAMIAQIVGCITNVILDPVFIFTFDMGIRGAAIATVLGQIASLIVLIIVMRKESTEIKINLRKLKFDKSIVKPWYLIALPTAVMNMISSITTTIMNTILVAYQEEAVTALSIYFKLQSFVFMPIFGLNQGALPILSYNYGAQNEDRYRKTVKLQLSIALSVMLLGTLLFQFAPDFLLNLFNPSEALRPIADNALRIISFSFIMAAGSIVMTNIFQSLGSGHNAMWMSILRQIGFLVPSAYLLGKYFGLDGVWYAYPLAEALVVIIFLPLCIRKVKQAFNG